MKHTAIKRIPIFAISLFAFLIAGNVTHNAPSQFAKCADHVSMESWPDSCWEISS